MIEVLHNTIKITFNEAKDVWESSAYEVKPNAKLSVVKRGIDEAMRMERRINIEAFHLGYSGAPERCTVVTLCEPETSYNDKTLRVRSAWVLLNGSRLKKPISSLLPMSAEPFINLMLQQREVAVQEQRYADDMKNRLPYFTAETLRDAVNDQPADASQETQR